VKVLTHFNATQNEAYGIWWVDPESGLLKSLYLDEDSPQAARGRTIIYSKADPDLQWSDWFDILTTRQPYFESWFVFDSKGLSPRQMLDSLREPSLPL
jgi:hypothetical protein